MIAEMRMLSWMCEVIKKDRIWNKSMSCINCKESERGLGIMMRVIQNQWEFKCDFKFNILGILRYLFKS